MKDKKIAEISPAESTKSTKRIPWWVNVLLAIGSYCTLKYVVPELQLTHPTLQKLAHAAPTFAPLTTIPFLLLAAKQLYDVDIGDVHKKAPGDSPADRPNEDPKKKQ